MKHGKWVGGGGGMVGKLVGVRAWWGSGWGGAMVVRVAKNYCNHL